MKRSRMHSLSTLLFGLLVLSGCGRILDPEQYIREDDAGLDGAAGSGGADGGIGGTDGSIDDAGVSEDACDTDDDGWWDAREACDVFAAEDEARDCDDDDSDVYPFAPAECGNGVLDNCQRIPEAWRDLGVRELVSFFDNSEASAGVNAGRQLSVAPRRAGEPGAFVTLMEDGRPVLRNVCLSDGNAVSFDSRTDLADATNSNSDQSVAVQKLAGGNDALLAWVGRTSVTDVGFTEQSTLWYGRLSDGSPETSSILVPAVECAGDRAAAPRLAIAGGPEPRVLWLQGLGSADSRTFTSFGPEDEFRCHATPMADGLQHIGSTSGEVVASVEASSPDTPRFWDGSDLPPQLLEVEGVGARSDLIALSDDLYALFYASRDAVGAKLLQCTAGERPLCEVQGDAAWGDSLSGTRGALAAGEALASDGAVTVHVERSGEGEDQFEDVLLDALGPDGELLTAGDDPWPYSLLFVTAPRTIVDLDVGATFSAEAGLHVYIAALTADQADADGLAPAGDELLLGGVRGCMER